MDTKDHNEADSAQQADENKTTGTSKLPIDVKYCPRKQLFPKSFLDT